MIVWGKTTLIRDIDSYLTTGCHTDKMYIITGEFNCVLDKEIDRYLSLNCGDMDVKELKTIIMKNNLTDIWREKKIHH